MIKNVLSLLAAFFVHGITTGQVTVSVQVAPTGVIQKSQLWNMVLVNTSENTVPVTVHLSLSNASDNTPVMTATSRLIHLSKGARQLTAKEVMPVQYNYYSPVFTDRNPDGFLPVGNYIACYIIYNGNKEIQLAEDCVPVEISPLAPPLLNRPEDEAVLETNYPQFSWLPPAPIQLFGNLTYDLVVVEVMNGQSPSEAIQQNIPRYFAGNQRSVVINYPASNKAFDTSKTYAWRVIAKNAGQFAGNSEVWTFKIRKDEPEKIIPGNGKYILIKSGQTSGVNTIEGNILGIKYYSFDKTHRTSIRFFNAKGELVKAADQQIVYGDNYLGYVLDNQFVKDKTYTIEITDSHGTKHVAFFRMQP